MRRRTIAARYALFAVAAMALNLGLQSVVLTTIRGPLALHFALGLGTAGGVALKYILDCRYIFAYVNRPIRENLVTFVLYTIMSGITTAVFWGIELFFDALFSARHITCLGGVAGLALGYTLKYQLDKKFVFVRRSS